jgi:uncharacterized protein (TIGR02145 family)
MYGGDSDANGKIETADKYPGWNTDAGIQSYVAVDLNLDSQVNNPDKDKIWEPNLGATTKIPTPLPFMCGSTFIDARDGQSYNTVQIGTQCWMGQNLNIGVMIPGDQEQTNHNVIEKYCHSDDAANCTVYGGLYSWDNMMQWSTTPGVQGICPAGWHLPSNVEWGDFVTALGGLAVAGGKLKEAGLEHWADPNTGATNSSGFTALPAGSRSYSEYGGWFHNLHTGAYYWLEQDNATMALYWQLYHYGEAMLTNYAGKSFGFSVRCIRD